MATFHFNSMSEALEPSKEKNNAAFRFNTVRRSLEEHTRSRNKVNNVNALEEQSEQNAEEAAYIANLNLSEEEFQQYLNNPKRFMKQLRKKLAKENRQSKRNTRRTAKLAEWMNRIHINATNRHNRAAGPRMTNYSRMGSPRRPVLEGGGTRRRTRRSRK